MICLYLTKISCTRCSFCWLLMAIHSVVQELSLFRLIPRNFLSVLPLFCKIVGFPVFFNSEMQGYTDKRNIVVFVCFIQVYQAISKHFRAAHFGAQRSYSCLSIREYRYIAFMVVFLEIELNAFSNCVNFHLKNTGIISLLGGILFPVTVYLTVLETFRYISFNRDIFKSLYDGLPFTNLLVTQLYGEIPLKDVCSYNFVFRKV